MFKGKYNQSLSHRLMISDTYRTLSYHKAINQQVTTDDIVIDFGTGSGILALMALKAGAKFVYCVERKQEARHLANLILTNNGYTNYKIFSNHYELIQQVQNADVIISESVGDHLIENASMKIFLNLCEHYKPRTTIPIELSLQVYPEVVTRINKGLEQVEKTVDINLDPIKDAVLINPLLDTSYFEGNKNIDEYWQIKNFNYSVDEGETIIKYNVFPLSFENNKFTDDGYVKFNFSINTNGLSEYGILLYWVARLTEDVTITNHPSRQEDMNHSYYQRIINIHNPKKKDTNTIQLILDIDFDDEVNEDLPCQNLKIKIK